MSCVIPAASVGEFDYLLREPRYARRLRRRLHITTGFVVLSAIACVVQLRLVNNESRQLALLRARLGVICATIARLRMECSCRPSEPSAGGQREAVARETCTASMLRMHQQA